MSTARHRARNAARRWLLPAAVLLAAGALMLSTTTADAYTYKFLPSYAGYIVGKQNVRAASANYVGGEIEVPTITCATPQDAFSQWFGFGVDGVKPPETLVQAGIVSSCDRERKPHIKVFTEVRLPYTGNRSDTGVDVQPGDIVQVSICPALGRPIDKQGHYNCATNAPTVTNYYMEIIVRDKYETMLGDFTRHAVANSSRAHAECLVEAPPLAYTDLPSPLARFTTANFGLCAIGLPVPAGSPAKFVDLNAGSGGYSSTKYDMRTDPPSLRFRASTSAPSGYPGDGDTFTVSWLSH